MFVDPDRTSDQTFLTAEPGDVAKAVERVTGVQTAPIPEVEPEEEASSLAAINEQLMAMTTGST